MADGAGTGLARTGLRAVVVLGLLAAVACGTDGETERADEEEDHAAVTWPAGATEPVVLVDAGGGLPPPYPPPERFEAVPRFVLYGGGDVVWEDDPSTFRSARIDDEGIRTVLGWAAEAGLLGPDELDLGEPEVFDVGGVWYDVTTDAGTQHTVVPAPGFDEGLTDAQVARRAVIAEFEAKLFSLPTTLPPERFTAGPGRYTAPGWEVLLQRATHQPELTGDEPSWTFGDPARVGRCRVLRGSAQRRLERAVTSTGLPLVWAVGDEPWILHARPLLPGSSAPCPAGA